MKIGQKYKSNSKFIDKLDELTFTTTVLAVFELLPSQNGAFEGGNKCETVKPAVIMS